eukprot:459064_1
MNNNKEDVTQEEKKEDNEQNIKVLFLDVDGVVNTYSTITVDDSVDAHLIKRLGKIIETTKCKIVLSSSWRSDKEAKQTLFKHMRQMASINIYNDINKQPNVYIGDTKDLDPEFSKNGNGVRSEEIMDFLSNIKQDYNVTHWVVIDDMKLGRNTKAKEIYGFKQHFCQTNPDHGISEDNMKTIIDILT